MRTPNPFPSVPQTGQGGAQVPSAGNAEPMSPVNRQAAPLGQTDSGQTDLGATAPAGGTGTAQTPGGARSPEAPRGAGEQATGAAGTPLDQPATDPATDPTALSSGGSARLGDNRQGAAGATLDECMKVWDATTHMTKEEWRRTCERTLAEYPDLDTPRPAGR
jgi:hypothetical protein